MKEFFTNNFALILSTTVSIVALLIPVYQAKTEKRISTMNMYLKMQYDAYCALFHEITILDFAKPPINLCTLHEAAHKAMLVSTHRNAEAIKNFCIVYADILLDPSNENYKREFKESMNTLTALLRDELFRFDTMKRKSPKFFK